MIPKILAGIETEYGLSIEGRGAEQQLDDAKELVACAPALSFVGWDYRHESPRNDLRGFRLDRLTQDPADARYDEGRVRISDHELRADRVLTNGARFYNDHGHPEYATPECTSLDELMLHDKAGELIVMDAARTYRELTGRTVTIYKNNVDFHGASYGTHESYLCPRHLGFKGLYDAVCPMLVARQILCGSGKVGAQDGASGFQISQRADFFSEPFNAETLFKRPIFNTRDEPHADPRKYIRLHVICGDANLIPSCTRRKVGLVKLAIMLAMAGEAPSWRLADPVVAFKAVSRDECYGFEIQLENGTWTSAYEIIESYLSAAERVFSLDLEYQELVLDCRELMGLLRSDFDRFSMRVDWAAKRVMLERYIKAENCSLDDSIMRALDLEYHNLDREAGLFGALDEMGAVEAGLPLEELLKRTQESAEHNRAWARGVAVRNLSPSIKTLSWSSVTFSDGSEVYLDPAVDYPLELGGAKDVDTYVRTIGKVNPC